MSRWIAGFAVVLLSLSLLPGCGDDAVLAGNDAATAGGEDGSGLGDVSAGADVQATKDTKVGDDATADATADVPPLCTAADCDDKNPCTADNCDLVAGCQHTPADGDCDDGDACTDKDACKDGKCAPGAAKQCDDKNACTSDSCDKTKGCVSAPLDATPCEDGDACTSGDTCKAGQCTSGKPTDCDDKLTCTTDSCDKTSGCAHLALSATPCDDGDGCTKDDTCKDGKCGSGAALTCDDKNPCTDDTCDIVKGCTFTNNTAPCTDGNSCNGADLCKDGKCSAGTTLVACDDKNPCTDDTCDAVSGNCVYLPNAASCSDGDTCTAGDTCAGGLCAGAPSCACKADADCDDKNPCTQDACTDAVCKFSPVASGACSDGDTCTEGDACKDGKCQAGAAKVCDDKNPCTDDSCLAGVGCVAKNNTAACDDGNTCTSGDACKAGVCIGASSCACKADADCDDKNACTDDACVAGACVNKASGAGKVCEDGNGCTVDDKCQGGVCVPGAAKACDDQNACTDDACDPKGGGCLHNNNSTPCNDGNACTTADACKAGACAGGGILLCDDKNPCTADTCDKATGCVATNTSDKCDDGNACTTVDMCDKGSCVGSTPPVCDDKNVCTDDSCDPTKGCVTVFNAIACDDKNPCTTGDGCKLGGCLGTTPLDCDDKNACTDDSCNPSNATGCEHVNNTLACDDGDACTTLDTCAAAKCVGGVAPNCDDQNPCTTDSCDKLKGCLHPNQSNGTVCGDPTCNGLSHSDPSTCFSGFCLPGAKSNCDDGNVCTIDACDPTLGCSKSNSKAACDDGTACTKGDACNNGSCISGAPVVCNDGNDCTNDACDIAIGCTTTVASDNTVCIDPSCKTGKFDPGALCKTGTCTPIAPPTDCDDKNACTDDACTPTAGCSHVNNVAVCSDGDACTTGDTCLGGACSVNKPTVCDDKNPCTDDTCDKLQGCLKTNNTLACDDGTVCTEKDTCAAGACKGTAVDCNDNNVCTDEVCDAVKGCQYTNNTKLCDDGNTCNANDICGAGVCKGTGGLNCDDGNPCTVDTCDKVTGCKSTAAADGTACTASSCTNSGFQDSAVCKAGKCGAVPAVLSCDDANVCTSDLCNSNDGCLHSANTALCNDSNACTSGDTCAATKCVGATVNCDDSNPCTDDSCDPATGCVHKNNTAVCDDGDACTTGDICANAKCKGPKVTNCDDKNACTDDSCSSKLGCQHVNNVAVCDDGDACTTGDTCKGGACTVSQPTVCDDKNVCTTDSCDSAKGCVTVPNTAPCDDGNACTTKDTCANNACVGGPAPVCNDSNACTTDSCDKVNGCVYTLLTAGAQCTNPSCNGTTYTAPGTCTALGACVIPAAKPCDDANQCTTDACDAKLGCVNTAVAYGTACTPADATLAYGFCHNTYCTGLAEKSYFISTTQGPTNLLTGMDRNGNNLWLSGTTIWQTQPVGVMYSLTDPPIVLNFTADSGGNSYLSGVRRRLAIGGSSNNNNGVTMTIGGGGWNVTNAGVNNWTKGGIATDWASGANNSEIYYLGGDADPSQNNTYKSNISRVTYSQGNGFGDSVRMYAAAAAGNGCNVPVPLVVRDIYAASTTAVFYAGTVAGANGDSSVVGYYDGNNTNQCGNIQNFNGLVTTNSTAAADFTVAQNAAASPPIGVFRAIHGSSATHMLLGGSLGTLYSFDADKWTQQTVSVKGAAIAWGSGFDIRSVQVVGTDGWAVGEYTSAGTPACRSMFVLHGNFDAAAGTWTWNQLLVTTKDLSSCGTATDQARTAVRRAFYDATTGWLYIVGSQGTNAQGTVVQSGATLTANMVVRIRTK